MPARASSDRPQRDSRSSHGSRALADVAHHMLRVSLTAIKQRESIGTYKLIPRQCPALQRSPCHVIARSLTRHQGVDE